MKIFSAVGRYKQDGLRRFAFRNKSTVFIKTDHFLIDSVSVKMIRTCQPQSNGGASATSRTGKSDSSLYSNKVHIKHLIYELMNLSWSCKKSVKSRA